MRVIRTFAPLLGIVLLAGCASFHADVEKGRDLRGYTHLFVLRNPTDDHFVALMLVNALSGRGYDVASGPETMMPDATDAILTYQDRWVWDFKNHMIGLKVVVRDVAQEKEVAMSTYADATSLKVSPEHVADRLIQQLFGAGPKTAVVVPTLK